MADGKKGSDENESTRWGAKGSTVGAEDHLYHKHTSSNEEGQSFKNSAINKSNWGGDPRRGRLLQVLM